MAAECAEPEKKDARLPRYFCNLLNFIDTTFELFTVTELQFNITTHYLVPTHIMLSESAASDFTKMMGINIPILLKTDPVCRFYNFPRPTHI